MARYKIGDMIGGRVVVQVIESGGKTVYGYRYDSEPETVTPLFCSEGTMKRRDSKNNAQKRRRWWENSNGK